MLSKLQSKSLSTSSSCMQRTSISFSFKIFLTSVFFYFRPRHRLRVPISMFSSILSCFFWSNFIPHHNIVLPEWCSYTLNKRVDIFHHTRWRIAGNLVIEEVGDLDRDGILHPIHWQQMPLAQMARLPPPHPLTLPNKYNFIKKLSICFKLLEFMYFAKRNLLRRFYCHNNSWLYFGH